MIIADIDVYRAAKMLVDKHGKDAISEALKKSAKLYAAGDIAGGDTWGKIANAAGWMLYDDFYDGGVIQ